jgi:hypothetical protein
MARHNAVGRPGAGHGASVARLQQATPCFDQPTPGMTDRADFDSTPAQTLIGGILSYAESVDFDEFRRPADRQPASLDFDYVSSALYRITLRRKIAQHVRLRAAWVFLNSYPHRYVDQTAIHRERHGRSTKPYVHPQRYAALIALPCALVVCCKRAYRVTAYGPAARFSERHLRSDDRVQIEGAYLRRSRIVEGDVRADTIRHINGSVPPTTQASTPRIVPARPAHGAAGRSRPFRDARHEEAHSAPDAEFNEALAALML